MLHTFFLTTSDKNYIRMVLIRRRLLKYSPELVTHLQLCHYPDISKGVFSNHVGIVKMQTTRNRRTGRIKPISPNSTYGVLAHPIITA